VRGDGVGGDIWWGYVTRMWLCFMFCFYGPA
jgi:hypothetical protein